MLTEMTVERRHPYYETVEESFTFVFDDENAEYIVKNVDGLGPMDVGLDKITSAETSAGNHQGTQENVRNIVITVGFTPNWSAGSTNTSLRQALNNVFIPGGPVHLTFTDSDIGVVEIDGIVETHEPDLFSDNPETQISIICVDPLFRSTDSDVVIAISPENFPAFNYPGDTPTDFVMTVDFTANLTTFEMLWIDPDIIWRASYAFLIGDKLTVSTVKGDKKVELLRSSVTTSLLDYWRGDLDNKLRRGTNWLETLDYPDYDIAITYRKKYGGL